MKKILLFSIFFFSLLFFGLNSANASACLCQTTGECVTQAYEHGCSAAATLDSLSGCPSDQIVRVANCEDTHVVYCNCPGSDTCTPVHVDNENYWGCNLCPDGVDNLQYETKEQCTSATTASNPDSYCLCPTAGTENFSDFCKKYTGIPCENVCSRGRLDFSFCIERKTMAEQQEEEKALESGLKEIAPVVEEAPASVKDVYEEYFGTEEGFLPACLQDPTLAFSKQCRNITVFIALGINVGRYLFGIVGALALAAFIYGGFMIILSSGDAEKLKKGYGAMSAAVIGLAVAFGGYIFIQYLGEVIGITEEFKL